MERQEAGGRRQELVSYESDSVQNAQDLGAVAFGVVNSE